MTFSNLAEVDTDYLRGRAGLCFGNEHIALLRATVRT